MCYMTVEVHKSHICFFSLAASIAPRIHCYPLFSSMIETQKKQSYPFFEEKREAVKYTLYMQYACVNVFACGQVMAFCQLDVL